jgi:hypothetical protein
MSSFSAAMAVTAKTMRTRIGRRVIEFEHGTKWWGGGVGGKKARCKLKNME